MNYVISLNHLNHIIVNESIISFSLYAGVSCQKEQEESKTTYTHTEISSFNVDLQIGRF